jgi:hypothetical protein
LLDTTFNPSGTQPGTVSTSINGYNLDNDAYSIALQSDGKIVAAGVAYDGLAYLFGIARFFGTSSTPTPSVPACAQRFIDKYGTRLSPVV